MPLSRRRFGQGLGSCLTLAATGVAAADAGALLHIRMSGFAFAPDPLQITAGDTVVWINDDLAPHTATALDQSWDTGPVEAGAEARLTFPSPGRFDYVCLYHPHMTGRLLVQPRRGG